MLHGRAYRLPTGPTVVICIDGFDPSYLAAGIEDWILPTISSFVGFGFHTTALSAMPSVTNPNNLSIITGAPTATHGIAGNYYLDRATGTEHMVLDDALVRGSTILAQMANAGVRVTAITAKDKLRKIINRGLFPGKNICFSAQKAFDCNIAEHGIENVEAWLNRPTPPQYSGELSLFVLDAGLQLLHEDRADLFYLTLSDYVQHTYAARSDEANAFMRAIDDRLGEFVKLGATVAVTGDHGMSDKADEAGNPNVLFLGDVLASKWPHAGARVICPIADPFVRHHGALGGFVRVHLTAPALLQEAVDVLAREMVAYCLTLPHVEAAYTGPKAAALFEMPPDREGHLVVIAKGDAVIGGRRDEHDLTQLQGHRLRSHGGLSEQKVPLLRSGVVERRKTDEGRVWRNFDVFDLALNY